MAVTMSATQDVEKITIFFYGLEDSYYYDLYSTDEKGVELLEVWHGTDEDVNLLKAQYDGTVKFDAKVFNSAGQWIAAPQTQITIENLVNVQTVTKGTTLTFNLGIFNAETQLQTSKYVVQFTDAYGNPIGKQLTAKIQNGVGTATSSVKLNGEVYYTITAQTKAKVAVDEHSGHVTAQDGIAPKAGKVTLTQLSQDEVYLAVSGFSDNVGVAKYQYSLNKYVGYQTLPSDNVISVAGVAIGKSTTIYVKALDAAGNESKVVAKSIKIKDVTDPICVAGKITDASAVVTTKGTTLSFSESNFSDNVQVKKYVVSFFYADGSQAGKSITVTAKKGVVSATTKIQFGDMVYYQVVALDAAKNDSAAISGQVQAVDGVAPKAGKVALTQVAQNQICVTVSGFSDNKGITQYQYAFSKNGNYQTLPEGGVIDVATAPYKTATVYVRALDAAGNVSKSVAKSIRIADVTEPDQVQNIAIAAVSAKNVTTFAWSIPYDNVGVTKYSVCVDGVWFTAKKNTLNVKNLADGEHTVSVLAQDKAGNVGEAGSATLYKGEMPSGIDVTLGCAGVFSSQEALPQVSDVTGTAYADKVTVSAYSLAHVEKVELGSRNDQLVIGDGAYCQIDALDFGAGVDQLVIGNNATVWLNANVDAASFGMSVGAGSTLYLAGTLLNYAQSHAASWAGVVIDEWSLSDGGLSQTGSGDDPFKQLAMK